MVWLEFADETLYSTYPGRFALLRWIRQNPEFHEEVEKVVTAAKWTRWPRDGVLM